MKMIKDIDRNDYVGIGKPGPLTGDLSDYWSRRLDDCNRIVYKIKEDTVLIASVEAITGTNKQRDNAPSE